MSKDDGLILKRFGKYLLLDHFVDGGMAKICRARFLGEQADKIVAIKMIQAQYFADEAFRNMFLDEIKVTFGLIHPNITQTFDYGMEDNQLYQVMEYVNGKNLKEYLDKLKKRGYVFPVEVSVYVVAQACQGLHYAHTFKNQLTGESAHIIHRDISPHNIMLTYDGAVKIIDFGIAKASSNSDKTQAGTIKGKLSYLAPEYLDGLDLDARYDQFAVGITLWEMLCSRKLFSAKNDLAVLKKIQACKIPPPSSINPNVPKALDKIVLKALEKDRDLRYENLDQMNRALIKFLYSKYPEFNATDLAYFSQELFKDVIKQDQDRFKEFGKIDIHPFLEEMRKGVPVASKNKIYDDDVIIIQDEAEDNEQLESYGDRSAIKTATRRTEIDLGTTDNASAPDLEVEGISKKRSLRVDLKQNQSGDVSSTRTNRRLYTGASASGSKDRASATGVRASADSTNRPAFRAPGTKTGVRMRVSTRTGVKLNPGNTKTKTKRSSNSGSDSHSSGAFFKLLVAGLFVAVAWFGYEKYVGSKKIVPQVEEDPIAEKIKAVQIDRRVASEGVGTLKLNNFHFYDKTKHKLYLDGVLYTQMANVLTGEIENLKIPERGEMTIRVEYDDEHEYLVKKVFFNDGLASIDLISQDQLPLARYASLTGGGTCNAKGIISFEMFGENRKEPVPIQNFIAFALGSYTIKYTPERNDKIDYKELTLNVQFDTPDNSIDICKEIIKVLEDGSGSR